MSAMSRLSGVLLCTGLLASPALMWAKTSESCSVAQFKAVALRIHQPDNRSAAIEKWLISHAGACTDAQLNTLNANSPLWLGTALTPTIAALIEAAIEAKIAGQPLEMGKLYESMGREAQSPSTETVGLPRPRAPVVKPSTNKGVLSGHVNNGSISQGNVINQNEIALKNNSQLLNNNLNGSAGATAQQGAPSGKAPAVPAAAAAPPANAVTPGNVNTNQSANLNNAPGAQVVQGAASGVPAKPGVSAPR